MVLLATKKLPLATAYRKTVPEYIVPMPITAAYPVTDNYTIDLPKELNIHLTFHISLLKPYIPNDNNRFPSHTITKSGPLVEFEDERYELERIIKEKANPRTGQVLYYIKWKGWGHQDNTWEPADNIDPGAIEEFHNRTSASIPRASTTRKVRKTKNQRRTKATIRE